MKTIISLIAALIITATSLSAQDKETSPYSVSKASIENLKVGLKSDNLGLRKCCIYFIGKYKINDAAQPLVDLMDKEQNVSARILIAFSLYYLNDETGMNKIKEKATTDENYRVRIICSAIYDEYAKVNDIDYIQLSGRE